MKRLLLFLALCLTASAQKFTIDQVMSAPFPNQMTAARKAPIVAWVLNDHGASNVWVAEAPDWNGRQLTHYQGDMGMPLAALTFTDDGKTVLYARGTETNAEGLVANPTTQMKLPKQQVFSVDVASSGEPKLLGDMGCNEEGCEDIQASPDGKWAVWSAKKKLWMAPTDGSKPAREVVQVRGDNVDPHWSPDGKHIAFVTDRNDHSFVAIYDLDPERVRYVAPTVDRDEMPRWSPDGQKLLFVRRNGAEQRMTLIPLHPDPWSIWVSDDAATADRPTARELWHSAKTLAGSLPWHIDECLHFLANGVIIFNSEQDGRSHLYTISREKTSIPQQAKLLTSGDFDVESTTESPDATEIIYTSNQYSSDRGDEDRRHLWRLKAPEWKPEQVTKGETIEWAPVIASDGTVLCLGSSATTPSTAYRVTANSREMLAPQTIPADFPSAALVTPKQVIFKAADGTTIHGQLFVPKNQTGPTPAIIHTHGGPPRQMMLGFHYSYYYYNAYAANQYLANLGYVVLSVNYRLGIMYGRAFRRVPNGGPRGGAEYQDLLAGAKYLQTLPIVDRNKIGLWGGSYGGYMTAMGLARNSDIFKAGVDFHGVHDWSALRTYRWDNSLAAPDAHAAADLAFKSSPDASLSGWKSPVLFIHGDDDRNVSFTETTNIIQHLRKQNVDYEELIFPDEIHDLLLWKDWVTSYRAMGDFFRRKLK